jgi:hypothetical protein
MTDREKLIDLMKESGVAFPISTANFLIANGVTVQQWIPVTERLPENDQYALCVMEDGSFRVFQWNYIDWMWNDGNEWWQEKDVTHWMPLPEPPKGE